MYYNELTTNLTPYEDLLSEANIHYSNHPLTYVNKCAVRLSFLKLFLSHLALQYKQGVAWYSTDTLTRNTWNTTEQIKRHLKSLDDYQQTYPLCSDQTLITTEHSIKIIGVTGQITEVFETAIPTNISAGRAVELNNISLALKCTPKHRVRVLKTPANNIIIYTTKFIPGLTGAFENDYEFIRKIIAVMPLMFGWTDENLINFCRMHTSNDASCLRTFYEDWLNHLDILINRKYQALKDFQHQLKQGSVSAVNRRIDEVQRRLNSLEKDYRDELNILNQLHEHHAYLKYEMPDLLTDDEIHMLIDKKIIYNIRPTNYQNSIQFECEQICINYDKDAAKKYYQRNEDNLSTDTAQLFKLLFIDEKVKIIFNERILLDVENKTLNAKYSNFTEYPWINNNMPNPHHYYYNCWGNYGPQLTKNLQDYKYLDVFFIIATAVASLNMTDYTVLSKFIMLLDTCFTTMNTRKCFIIPDDKDLTKRYNATEILNIFKEENSNASDTTD